MRKTVFISGSNRGIGKQTAIVFAKNGWNIIAHVRVLSEKFESFVEELKAEYGVEVLTVCFDMLDEASMKAQIKDNLTKKKIKIDTLVNNAGAISIKLFMLTSLSEIRNSFETNLFSHMRLTQLLIKRMNEGGSIINVTSMDAYEPQKGESGYAAAKAAMIAWTEVMKKEFLGRFRVNAVAPHSVDTDLARDIADKAAWKEEELINPMSVAKAIYFLASDEAEGITGEIMQINGNHS